MTAVAEWVTAEPAEWARTRRVLDRAKGAKPVKTLIVHLQNPNDPGRVDVIAIPEGTTLRDQEDGKRYRPFLPVGSMVAVELREEQESPDV